jgi:hypothetical protein
MGWSEPIPGFLQRLQIRAQSTKSCSVFEHQYSVFSLSSSCWFQIKKHPRMTSKFTNCYNIQKKKKVVVTFRGLQTKYHYPRQIIVCFFSPQLEFANILKSPGIDSQPGGPLWQSYLTYRPALVHGLVGTDSWVPSTFTNSGSVYPIMFRSSTLLFSIFTV